MKKLALSMDDLKVESYATEVPSEERGTVLGNSLPTLPLCTRHGCITGTCATSEGVC
jgi:hypothetical protein